MHRCCDDFGDCNQGRLCPVRHAVAPAMPLDTDNSDGTSAGHADDELLDDTGLPILRGMVLVWFVVSVLMYGSLWF